MTLRSSTIFALLTAAVTVLAGCAESDPPPFRLDMARVVNDQISPDHQQAIANILGALFGTPDKPYALPETGLDLRKLQMAAGPTWSDQQGAKHGLYRRHCAHCHGINGDGKGPTAMILNPYPRDYREGVFKFKSTYNPDRPTDHDLRLILHNGVPGTAMPSFALLPRDEVDALLEYVKYLSMRGQMEIALGNFVFDELDVEDQLDPSQDEEQQEIVMELLTEIVEGWQAAADEVIVPVADDLPARQRTPEEIAASVAKGRELFYGTKANCFSCHGPTGLGDGQQTDFDLWMASDRDFRLKTESLEASIQDQRRALSDQKGEAYDDAVAKLKQDNRELAQRLDIIPSLLPVRNAIPRNLRDGIYRGGQRPVDLFWRIHQGIAGTPMPAAGPASPGAQGTLTEEEIWHLVDYVRSLPFEPASRPPKSNTNIREVVN